MEFVLLIGLTLMVVVLIKSFQLFVFQFKELGLLFWVAAIVVPGPGWLALLVAAIYQFGLEAENKRLRRQ